MKFLARASGIYFDLNGYKKKLADEMRKALKEGVIVWLNATVRTVVPTWSGASRATYESIAKKAGTTIKYGPLRARKDRRALGRRESRSKFQASASKSVYFFEWETSLRYFILNEYTRQTYKPGAKDTGSGKILSPRGLNRPGPYHLTEKGMAALQRFATEVKLPNPFPYLKVRKNG